MRKCRCGQGSHRGPKDGGTDASASPQNDKIERWCRGTQIRGPGKNAVRWADDIRPYNSPAAWFGAPSRRAPRRHDPTTMRRAADSRPCPRVILSAAKDPFPPSFRETSGDGGTDASASPQNDKIERWCRGTQIRGPGKNAVRWADDIRPYNSPAAWFGAPSRRAPRRHDPTTMRRAADSRPCPRVILSAAKDPFPPSFRETSGDGSTDASPSAQNDETGRVWDECG